MNDTLQRIQGHVMESWKRKLIVLNGAFYVNIPMPIICANAKRKGSVIEFQRVFDEKSGKILVVLNLDS